MQKNKLEYLLLFLILAFALFIRIYRINDLLGFWYDQGRDALVIWDFIHKGKLFLIGPTTGIEGIFRGPWYYWLITPFYWLGRGDPVYPTVFLAFTSVIAIGIMYFLVRGIGGRVPAFIAIMIASFSHYFISSSRWLSNPTPMFLISMLFLLSLFALNKKIKWSLPFSLLTFGMAMQFGSAAEIFYLPSLLFVLYINRKNLPGLGYFVIGFSLPLMVFAPQIIFDIKHDGILRNSVRKFILEDSGFEFSLWLVIKNRLLFYYDLIVSKFWVERKILTVPFILTAIISGYFKRKKLFENKDFKTLLVVLMLPLAGTLFFQGNKGTLYDYYFTGYYLLIIMVFSILMGLIYERLAGKLIILSFLTLFIVINAFSLNKDYFINLSSKKAIVLGNELRAVEWVYADTGDKRFNVDVYVPPVIPYAYDYLFLWKGSAVGRYPDKELSNLLYTVYEEDDYLPSRLTSWLDRQAGIGKVMESKTFGGVTVQRRIRYEKSLER